MQHQPTISETLASAREAYLVKWSNGNALKFEADGHYEWMTDQIDGYHKVLEIGTGDGRGTVALAKRGHSVVSIDENGACLLSARDRLSAEGVNVQYVDREKLKPGGPVYSIRYKYPTVSPLDPGVLLMDGDLNNDPKLFKWLGDNGPFDAVICWLIGTHDGRTFNTAVLEAGVKNILEYRLYTQNRVYEVADTILRPGGVLNVIDRGAPLSEYQLSQFLHLHGDQASGTSLQYLTHAEHPYEESVSDQKVTMVMTQPGDIDPNIADLSKSLASITFRKP